MLTLIIGGSASGKSELAEKLTMFLPGRRIYLATMMPWGEEGQARIRKHRAARAERQFETIERYTDLQGLPLPEDANILLECLGNLTANELYDPSGRGSAAVISGVMSLHERCRHLTIVTNEVFSGGTDYEGDTLRYLKALAEVNRMIAAKADLVIEAVCGLPNVLKGEIPC